VDAWLDIVGHLPQPAFAVSVASGTFRYVAANEAYTNLVVDAGPESEAPADYQPHLARAVADRTVVCFEVRAPGDKVLLVDCGPVVDGEGRVTHVVCLARDVTEHRRVEAALAHQARHDVLTNLPNRVALVEQLDQELRRSRVGLVFVDIDDFDVVNASVGHDAGDALLMVVARRIERVLREGDSAARFGGDQLAVVCHDVAGPDEVRAVAARIQRVFREPFVLDAGEVRLSASLGIALSTGPDDRAERLLLDADVALGYAKTKGRGAVEVFDDHIRERARERFETERGITRAIERGELRVHYQPVVRFDRSEIVGFEALVRWQHPERGLLPPGAFLPVAEGAGLIGAIGSWVLHEACRQAAAWESESTYDTPLAVSVNVSAAQLTRDLVPTVEHALASASLAPASLVLEVSERALADGVERAAAVLGRLSASGVRIAVDDFGTGLASLTHLRRLPVDFLKIDTSLIEHLGARADDGAVVAAVVQLGHALGLAVAAEGVETPRQLSELRSIGCDLGQGFYFARPQPGEVVKALVHRRFQWKQPA